MLAYLDKLEATELTAACFNDSAFAFFPLLSHMGLCAGSRLFTFSHCPYGPVCRDGGRRRVRAARLSSLVVMVEIDHAHWNILGRDGKGQIRLQGMTVVRRAPGTEASSGTSSRTFSRYPFEQD